MSKQSVMGPVVELRVEELAPFAVNPFGLYEGQRFDDLVESIESSGVLVPVIVRPLEEYSDNGTRYEILSGHNRVEAVRALGLATVPSVIREDLNDDEALLVLVETNLHQRSLADLSHSERAITLSIHHGALKSQGRRTDLIREVEELFKAEAENDKTAGSGTFAPVAQKLNTRDRIACEQGLSKDTVARYLRVNQLIQAHKDRLDNGVFALRTAVALSYLSATEQGIVDEVLRTERHRLSMAEAETLRRAKRPLTREAVLRIVEGTVRGGTSIRSGFKLDQEFISRYFKPEQSREDIEAIIAAALDQYLGKKSPDRN